MDDTEIDHDYDQSVEIEQDRTTHFKLTLAKPERVDTDGGLADVPFADFKAGADAGTFLHKLYEEIDFTAAKDPLKARATLDTLITTWGPYHGLAPELWTEAHKDAFLATLTTPLGDHSKARASAIFADATASMSSNFICLSPADSTGKIAMSIGRSTQPHLPKPCSNETLTSMSSYRMPTLNNSVKDCRPSDWQAFSKGLSTSCFGPRIP